MSMLKCMVEDLANIEVQKTENVLTLSFMQLKAAEAMF